MRLSTPTAVCFLSLRILALAHPIHKPPDALTLDEAARELYPAGSGTTIAACATPVLGGDDSAGYVLRPVDGAPPGPGLADRVKYSNRQSLVVYEKRELSKEGKIGLGVGLGVVLGLVFTFILVLLWRRLGSLYGEAPSVELEADSPLPVEADIHLEPWHQNVTVRR